METAEEDPLEDCLRSQFQERSEEQELVRIMTVNESLKETLERWHEVFRFLPLSCFLTSEWRVYPGTGASVHAACRRQEAS